jgi:hypothetical protein
VTRAPVASMRSVTRPVAIEALAQRAGVGRVDLCQAAGAVAGEAS